MTKHRTFNPLDPLPADWPNSLSEYASTLSSNLQVKIKSGTPATLQVAAGLGSDQVAIGINGRWRFISSTIERASPGGVARTLDVHVTASDNSLIAGDPETDATDYSFALAVVEHNATPAGVALTRLIATAVWDGTKFTAVDHLVGAWSGVSRHASTHATGGSDPIAPADIGALATVGDQTLTGKLTITDTLTANAGLVVPATGGVALRSKQVAAGTVLQNDLLSGDTNPAFRILGDGTTKWGPGGGSALDTTLARSGTGALALTGALSVSSTLTATAGVTSPAITGTAYRSAQIAAQTVQANFLLTADANPAFSILGDGKMQWGAGGASAIDANLYRAAAGLLKSDTALLTVGQFTSQNSVWATPASSTSTAFVATAQGDANSRFVVRADGRQSWGDGTSVVDTVLARTGVSTLGLTGALTVSTTLTATGGLIVPAVATALATNATAGQFAHLNKLLSTDANPSWRVLGDGAMAWGPGGATAVDTFLTRSSAGRLAVTGGLLIASNATTAGTVNLLDVGPGASPATVAGSGTGGSGIFLVSSSGGATSGTTGQTGGGGGGISLTGGAGGAAPSGSTNGPGGGVTIEGGAAGGGAGTAGTVGQISLGAGRGDLIFGNATTKMAFFGGTLRARPAAYTNSSGLAASRTLPAAPTVNQVAQFVLQMLTDLGSTSGFGLLNF